MSGKIAPQRRKRLRSVNAPPTHAFDPSRHLLRGLEEERKRISRELHDETGQGLMVLRLYLGMLSGEIRNSESLQKIQQATELLDRTIGGLRRIIGRLSPRVLDELGLLDAIRKEARDLSKNTGMKAHLDLAEDLEELDHEIEIAIYRSVQEALHNVAKHSRARNFAVQLKKKDAALCLLIEDDGVGLSRKGASRAQSFGLLGMRERIAALGGTVRIRSRNGTGTSLRIVLPASQNALMRRREPRGEMVRFESRAAAERS